MSDNKLLSCIKLQFLFIIYFFFISILFVYSDENLRDILESFQEMFET